jgi:hypothetical protein
MNSLPDELLLNIVEYLVPSNKDVPITGVNAVWTPTATVERRHTLHHLDACATSWFEDEGDLPYDFDGMFTCTNEATPLTRYSTLWALRQ